MALVRHRFQLNRSEGVDCWVFQTFDANGRDQFWFKADDLARFIKYDNPEEAIKARVSPRWKTTWSILRDGLRQDSLQPENLQASTVFILEPGLHELIDWSESEEADQILDFIYEDVLPSLRDNGQLKVEIVKRDAQIAVLQEQLDNLNKQLLVSNEELRKALQDASSLSHKLADIAFQAVCALTSGQDSKTIRLSTFSQQLENGSLLNLEKEFFPVFKKPKS